MQSRIFKRRFRSLVIVVAAAGCAAWAPIPEVGGATEPTWNAAEVLALLCGDPAEADTDGARGRILHRLHVPDAPHAVLRTTP